MPCDAGQGDSSRSGHTCSAERPSRVVHVRTPVNRASSAAVSTASARARKGPIAVSRLGVRTEENRGKASSVSATHHHRCGNFDRRLFGGAGGGGRGRSPPPPPP